MKIEDISQQGIKKMLNSELYALRLRAIQLYEKYLEIEKKEILIDVNWDSFYKNYKFLTDELSKRNLNFTRRSIDKVLEKAKYFGIKIIEKYDAVTDKNHFAMLLQVGQSNILVNPTVEKEQIKEQINGIIVTKSTLNTWIKIKSYPKEIPIYATGKIFDKISSKEKHLFIKSLKIGKGQVLIRPIKITYKKKSPVIGLGISKKDVKLSILPKFLSLSKGAQDLIKGTVWICEVGKYDKDDSVEESVCFLSLVELAKALKPKKLFIVNMDEDLLKHKDEINQELKKWQGRILYDRDTLEEDEIMKGLVWEINELDTNVLDLDMFDGFSKFAKNKVIMEVNFNGVRARVEKKDRDVIVMINPDDIEGSPLQSKKLPLQVGEVESFRDDFVGDAVIVIADEEKNKCLGDEAVKDFLKQKPDSEEIGKKVHIFVSDLLQLNGKDISKWTLEKRKKMMDNFGNREHVHFIRSIADTEKNSLSYIVDVSNKEEIKKVFESIMEVSEEGKFYPKNIAKSVVVKCLDCPYLAKRIVISKPETTANYHRIPVTDCKITATINISEAKGIKALYCGDSKKIATYLFAIDKWTMAEAKAWVKDSLKKAQHKRTECMECSKTPAYECLWAEGIGHAWFCKEHFKEWSTKGDGKGEIDYVKEVQNGEAAKKFGENTNPNIVKEVLKQDDTFDCKCTECDKEIKSAVDCAEVNCPECGSEMKTKGAPSPEKTEKANVRFDFKKVGKEPEFIVGGIVYPSNKVDSQGHFARQGAVWEALKGFMRNKGSIKVMHKGKARNIPIIESYFVEEDHHKGGRGEQHVIKKGDFWLSVYLGDNENLDVWEDVKSGKLTGWSMAGKASQGDAYIY